MQLIETGFKELFVLQAQAFEDDRGCFFESYNSRWFVQNNLAYFFVQDNASESHYGVIRGLHFQTGARSQAKLVRVSHGEVLDVVVDLRSESETFGKSFSIILSRSNKKQLLIPRGFAHGYSVLSEDCIFNYKCDNFYDKNSESGIHPLDPHLNIDWMIPQEFQKISEKDRHLQFYKQLESLKK
ncbi:MAG TPA: dTDP-4-dehydrorhamnose 3,5-epimerase [Saprospiraceae bacterium]|nr:dTDP-4-dehydrorhamnose 3,5-epimerase [Saprospiraceae bacterium]